MTIRDIAISFGYDVDKNSEKKANDSISKLKSVASKALGAIAVVFSIKGLASLAEAAANAEALESQFTQVFGEMENQATKTLDGIAKETGVLAGRMQGSFVQIAAFAKTSGMNTADSLSLSERAMRAVADSAAFYDRSLEEVTGSLQSFLKDNFANDAALGLSATETTRNTAANALYGKSFKDLAEDQKQLTLLQMVEDANKMSGAMGQAARESDTWGNQLGNLKQGLKDLKVAAGSAFLKPAIQVLKLLSQLVGYATKAIKDMTAEGRVLNRVFESFNNGIKRAQVFVENFVNRIGGAENAFRLLALVAGSLFIAMNAGPILSFVKNLIKGLNLASLKILAMAAIVALVILAVDDFINFMQGNDSVIGALFEKWGIDADGVRASIIETWNKVKTFLLDVWDGIKAVAERVWGALSKWWEENGEGVLKSLQTIWESIVGILTGLWEGLQALLEPILDALGVAFEDWGDGVDGVVNFIMDLFKGLLDFCSVLFSYISKLIENMKPVFAAIGTIVAGVIKVIKGIIDFIKAVFTGDWDAAWQAIKDIFAGIWDVLKGIVTAVVEFFKAIWKTFENVFIGIWEGIKNFFEGIWNSIKSFFQGVWDFLVGIVKTNIAIWQAIFQAVGDFFQSIWNAIVGFFQGVWDTISGAVTAAGETLKAVFTAVGDFFKSIWDGIVTFFSGIWDTLVSSVTGAGDKIEGIFTAVGDFFKGIWDGITGFFSGIWDGITNTVSSAVDKIKAFLQPLLDTIGAVTGAVGSIADGVKGTVGGAVDKVKGVFGFAKGTESTPDTFVAGENGPELIAGAKGRKVFTADKTSGIIGAINGAVQIAANVVGAAKNALSEPKKVDVNVTAPQSGGSVAEAVKGIGGIINSSFKFLSEKLPQAKEAADKSGITEAIRAFGTDIAFLAKSATASFSTVQSMVSSTTNRSIMQNNYFENTFNGERAAQQRSKAAADKNSSDATGQLARALAYAR